MMSRYRQTEIGEVPENWRVEKIGNITSTITKGTTPTTLGHSFTDTGINFIKVENISEDGLVNVDTLTHINEETNHVLSRSKLEINDILFSIAGAIGRSAIVKAEILPANINQAVAVLRPATKSVVPLFLKYYLSSKRVVDFIKSRVVQSVQSNVSLAVLGDTPIALPALSEQRAIAKILSDLDKKIELNRQMNKTLESIAQAIFKHWFVDFEFPDERGNPYKSSGGEMVKLELGEIPAGWRTGNLSELLSNIKSPLNPGQHLSDRKYVPIESMPMRALGLLEFKSHDEALSSLIAFEKGDILFGAMRAYFHRVNFAPFKGITRTTTFVLRPKDQLFFAFTLFLLNQDGSVDYANQNSRGTTMPYAVWENGLADMPVVIPGGSTMRDFSGIALPVLDMMLALSKEIDLLRGIRDSFLPKLMAGKLLVRRQCET